MPYNTEKEAYTKQYNKLLAEKREYLRKELIRFKAAYEAPIKETLEKKYPGKIEGIEYFLLREQFNSWYIWPILRVNIIIKNRNIFRYHSEKVLNAYFKISSHIEDTLCILPKFILIKTRFDKDFSYGNEKLEEHI